LVADPLSPLPALLAGGRFWQHTINTAEQSEEDFKHQALPLARIKKVMKSDPEVRVSRSSLLVSALETEGRAKLTRYIFRYR
jgi:hypothetical protein